MSKRFTGSGRIAMTKSTVLLMESENVASLNKVNITDGAVTIGDKTFFIDAHYPINLKGKFGGFTPLYICKWDKLEPSENMNKDMQKEELKRIYPEFSQKKHDLTPEMARKLMGLKILGNMIKPKSSIGNIMLLIMGVVVGVSIMFSLVYFKLIPTF